MQGNPKRTGYTNFNRYGKKNDVDKVRGLSLEADDYIVKPFSPSELVARVTSHIRIHERLLVNKEKADQSGIKIGRLKILPQERKVFFDRKEKELANKEFELLLFLAENPNIVFSKEYLFERVWGTDSDGRTATVTVHINRLREKLEPNASTPQYIETVWGRINFRNGTLFMMRIEDRNMLEKSLVL